MLHIVMHKILLTTTLFLTGCLCFNLTLRYPPPSIRDAPHGYNGYNFGRWPPPAIQQLLGAFYVTHSSCTAWKDGIINLDAEYRQVDSEIDNSRGDMTERLSWSCSSLKAEERCAGPDAIITLVGNEQATGAQGPTDIKYTAAWNYQATDSPEIDLQQLHRRDAIIAYGHQNDQDWMVRYSDWIAGTAGFCRGPQFSVLSKSKTGISEELADDIVEQLNELGAELQDDEFSALAQSIKALRRDDH